ncbi:MAG TPA: hypothetical protein VKV39_09535 [Candidatus Sulfotelmatobacter sp.]|nr:hypothetical protein [Candidatus Sulfotelmatobacter sp.]
MEAITGVFKASETAQKAFDRLKQSASVHPDKITVLAPGSEAEIEREVEGIPADATEQPGMGKAIGALTGGGIGIAGGSLLVTLLPGVGPISAVGLLGAAILGAAGATAGAKVGGKAEESLSEGIPEDEIFVYEDALRQGRTVLVALVDDEKAAKVAREILQEEGAESVDAAREQWWIGLRSAEQGHYEKDGNNFADDERFYRLGFEAALHARTRCKEFDQVSAEMDAALEDVKRQYPGANVEEPFTRGYQRGRDHYQQLCDQGKKAA